MDAIKYFETKKRMTNGCKSASTCNTCPFSVQYNDVGESCVDLEMLCPEKTVEIIEKWAEEHPVKTRQSEFLKLIPNANVDKDGVLDVCPRSVERLFEYQCNNRICRECRKEYWLVEIRNEEVER